ncbi:hypothetical protein RN001_002603 [Aquatica leii]|uniref:DUF4806 domain-containing protein n=1 Tax=Aquatica leii TaxID=1421715 RepID=A0AAN7PH49_9COLE|nr:hypothetical protein RN001_002603 [Aquatica leii]
MPSGWLCFERTFFGNCVYDFDKAHEKLKKAQFTSDLNSEPEASSLSKRSVKKPKKIVESISGSDDEKWTQLKLNSKFERPPKIERFVVSNKKQAIVKEGQFCLPSTPTSSSSQCRRSESSCLSLHKKTLENILYLREHKMNKFYCFYKTHKRRIEDLNQLEQYLTHDDNFASLTSYLASIDGKTLSTQTNRILKHILSDQLASSYNYFGLGNQKKAFSNLKLCQLVISSVKTISAHATEKDVEDAIKVWLKHASERFKKKGHA